MIPGLGSSSLRRLGTAIGALFAAAPVFLATGGFATDPAMLTRVSLPPPVAAPPSPRDGTSDLKDAPRPGFVKALHFGTFPQEVEAWADWTAIARRQPDMVTDIVPRVVPAGPGAPKDSFALLGSPLPDLDSAYLCRRIVGGGGICAITEVPDDAPSAVAPVPSSVPAEGAPAADPDAVAAERQTMERHTARLTRIAKIVPGIDAHVDSGALRASHWNLCSLTFDDGPHPLVTPRILDILRTERVRATFFPIGSVAAHHPGLIQRIVREGHEVGNHSLTHPNMRSLTPDMQRNEVAETNRILSSAGADPVLFRPPSGRWNQDTLQAVYGERMSPALWNLDTLDWHTRNADKILARVEETGNVGSVVLMHTTIGATADALPRTIAVLRNRGCRFVTLSEWIGSLTSLSTPRIAQK